MPYIITGGAAVFGCGATEEIARADVLRGSPDFNFDDSKIISATPSLVEYIETYGGADLSWSSLVDGTACTLQEHVNVVTALNTVIDGMIDNDTVNALGGDFTDWTAGSALDLYVTGETATDEDRQDLSEVETADVVERLEHWLRAKSLKTA